MDSVTFCHFLRIGDAVVMNMDAEARSWGRKGRPDGERGIVVGFSTAVIHRPRVHNFGNRPGVYHENGMPRILWEDGTGSYVGSYDIAMVDQIEYKARKKLSQFLRDPVWMEELPETKFWEGDVVLSSVGDTTVEYINYHYIGQMCDDGVTPMAVYDVAYPGGGRIAMRESNMILRRRGNVWKYFHNEPIEFADLKEEIAFFTSLGHYEEVRNPANALYLWTKDVVLAAIEGDIVDGFRMQNGLFGAAPSISAVKFKDRELGARVRKATLEGFNVTA